jgi:phosphatidylglycerophosphatase A
MMSAAANKSSKVRWGQTTWAWVTGTFFGVGLLPGGPGTWASLAAVGIWFLAGRATQWGSHNMMLAALAAAAAATMIGTPAASIVARECGREDPGLVVIDEVAGQWLALASSPVNARHALLAFVLFRLFDITKPPPVRQLERLHGGLGIMMDDVAAGVYALIGCLIAQQFVHFQ